MKVTRKYKDEFKALGPSKGDNGEISPSLSLRELPKPIEGLEAGQDFEAHIKGKCRGHECRADKEGGKETHHYDLDVSDFTHKGGGKEIKQKKSGRDEVEEAMDKYDKEDAEKKSKKESEKAESKK
jgi:hypothetical protein